jgi:acetyl esterase/lipase
VTLAMGCRSPWLAASILAALLAVREAAGQRLRPRDVDSLAAKPPTARIAYGTDSLQFGDLRLPAGPGPFPVVVLIHGGCWVHRLASLQNTTALADALRDAGVATWNVEYRRLDNPGGGWPGTFLDVAAAADSLRWLAQRYGLDLERVVAVGHSAGGHLALWLAARSKIPEGSPIRALKPIAVVGAVALGGPGDLRDFMTYGQRSCGAGVIDKLLGGTFEDVPDRWRAASPAELLPLGVRQRLVVGDDDFIMPERARDAYVARARASDDEVDLIVIPDAGHFEVIAPTTAAWPRVREAILELTRPRSRR